ncbi:MULTISPECIES: 2-hydroxyacid dehydrogenase [unclassified Pseudoalteromonas]|uniref:2-hydroxyacid dehydrogenase n=1 Tax=unclassified Pseudoalteromonas TaxID=194690 RepID=UPI000CF61BED|nr:MULTISPECIES: glyoxylate/hydroxypyruvate reductase A [unclassified Pseudoalteromonas]
MSLLLAIPNRNIERLEAQLQAQLGADKVQVWPNIVDAEGVDMVLGWQVPEELWSQLPNVRAVMSFGAGVDGLNLAAIPAHLPVGRIVDPELAADMAEYVLTQVLLHKTNMPRYMHQQEQQVWRPKRVRSHNRVGLLGFGQLGQAIAKRLSANGCSVMAYSNGAKTDSDEVQHFHGELGLNTMLAQSDYLVCILPLTEQTRGIINADLLAKLPDHAVVINVGRGAHVVEEDLLAALQAQQLGGASLDVFNQEPLPAEHMFWQTPNLIVTPHCSALSRIDTVVEQVVTNYQRLQRGEALLHCIDRQRQY